MALIPGGYGAFSATALVFNPSHMPSPGCGSGSGSTCRALWALSCPGLPAWKRWQQVNQGPTQGGIKGLVCDTNYLWGQPWNLPPPRPPLPQPGLDVGLVCTLPAVVGSF